MFQHKCSKTGKGLMTEGKGCPGKTKYRPEGEQDVNDICDIEKTRLRSLVEFVKGDETGDEFKDIRKNENKVLFETFVNMCLVTMKSVSEWRMKIYTTPLTNICTASDEAFAMIVFENHVDDYHLAMNSEDGEKKLERQKTSPRYTQAGSKKAVELKIVGWNKKGLKRFNELVKHLTKIRKETVPMEREVEIMKSYAELCGISGENMSENGEDTDTEDDSSIDGYDGFDGCDEDENENDER